MGREEFVALFGPVFEHSYWIAMQAWDIGLTHGEDTAASLLSSLIDVVEEAGHGPQLALLRGHPDLAGRVSCRVDLTGASQKEQVDAGLEDCSASEFYVFQELNLRYIKKFGFPFILAVRGRHRSEILKIFRDRLEHEVTDEFVEALQQVYQIAFLRLCEIE